MSDVSGPAQSRKLGLFRLISQKSQSRQTAICTYVLWPCSINYPETLTGPVHCVVYHKVPTINSLEEYVVQWIWYLLSLLTIATRNSVVYIPMNLDPGSSVAVFSSRWISQIRRRRWLCGRGQGSSTAQQQRRCCIIIWTPLLSPNLLSDNSTCTCIQLEA